MLNHGYIEPSVYVTGQGLMREQDALARAGFVVLHTDYRGHAASDPASDAATGRPASATPRDTINAVQLGEAAARTSTRTGSRCSAGRWAAGSPKRARGRKPGAGAAAVVFAPVSSDFVDNFSRWTVAERPDAAAATFSAATARRSRSPDFYRGLSARTYFDRITEPVLIHHGTHDESCPIRWSRTTQRLLRAGRGRLAPARSTRASTTRSVPQWPLSMDRTVRFLRRQLRT